MNGRYCLRTLAALAVGWILEACSGGSSILVTDEAPGAHCAQGGKRIDVTDDSGTVTTSYICSGATVVPELPGPNCPNGGIKVQVGSGAPSYVCNAYVVWTTVTANTTTQSNHGYFVDGAAEISLTLPSSLVVGDVVRVEGTGLGGWKILQNANQSIWFGDAAVGARGPWIPYGPSMNWKTVASSADGTKLVAAVSSGQIYTSTDSGATWAPRDSNRIWSALASSADGTKLVAAASSGQLYTSTDSGATWTPRDSTRSWLALASSADGTKLVASDNSQVYTSTDSGLTWTPRSLANCGSLASSADGTRLVCGTNLIAGAPLYTSLDSGLTWKAHDSSRTWNSVASSADGLKLVAAVWNGQIYTSVDSGLSWTPRDVNRPWVSVASSADGSRLIAAAYPGQLYTSTDSGATWTACDSIRNWTQVASSADGSKLVATAYSSGQIYASTGLVDVTTVGPSGGLAGPMGSAVELVYRGSSAFYVASHEGSLSAF